MFTYSLGLSSVRNIVHPVLARYVMPILRHPATLVVVGSLMGGVLTFIYKCIKQFMLTAPRHRRLQRGTRGRGRKILYPTAYTNLHVLAERLVDKVSDRRDRADMERRLFVELELQGLELYEDGHADGEPQTGGLILPGSSGVWRVASAKLSALQKQHFVSSAVEHVTSEEFISNVVEERREGWLIARTLYDLNGEHRIPGWVRGMKARLHWALNNALGASLVEPRL